MTTKHLAQVKAYNARARAALRVARATARDIPPIKPPTAKWKKTRASCRGDLELFCLTFLPEKFFLPFSPDHRTVIKKLERVVISGGQLAIAMPRGSGKTELVKSAILWATLYGYRRFCVLVGATASASVTIMDDIKASLQFNDLLHAAFPEATTAIRNIAGNSSRVRFQTIKGQPSGLDWSANSIQLARVPKAICAGAAIWVASLTGALRGMSISGPTGATIRPDLVLIDDAQDRESATSPTQTDEREKIVRGDILGLAGPTKTIAGLMACTVITENDLSERFLDRQRNPQWSGERTRLVHSFPTDEAAWATYFAMRDGDLRNGGDGSCARAHYRQNQAAMDAGAVVSWPERFDPARYASAIEEAMNRRHDDPEAFDCEYQNQPRRQNERQGLIKELHADDLVGRITALPRGVVPNTATHLSAMIDAGGSLLFFAVVAWDEKANGWLIDYGSFPEQPRPYFRTTDASPTLVDLYPGVGEPQRVYAGIKALSDRLMANQYQRDGEGPPMEIDRCLIDSAWLPDAIHQVIRESQHRSRLTASRGYAGSSNIRDMDEWPRRQGERIGPHWRLGIPPNRKERCCTFDPDHWKTRLVDLLTASPGGGCCLQFFGGDGPHRLLADHITAEYSTRVEARGRSFDKWTVRPGGYENHLLDCCVGACVAASVNGLSFAPNSQGTAPPRPSAPKPKVSLRALYEAKHGPISTQF